MAAVDLEHLTRLADTLSPSEKRRLIEHLSRQVPMASGEAAQSMEHPGKTNGVWQSKFARSHETGATLEAPEATEAVPQARIAGLTAGIVWMSDDFNDELPDEFWLGEQ
jgi:hypothetical protein